jgi:hypothetical protein
MLVLNIEEKERRGLGLGLGEEEDANLNQFVIYLVAGLLVV